MKLIHSPEKVIPCTPARLYSKTDLFSLRKDVIFDLLRGLDRIVLQKHSATRNIDHIFRQVFCCKGAAAYHGLRRYMGQQPVGEGNEYIVSVTGMYIQKE